MPMQTLITPWELNQIDLELVDLALMEDLGWPFCDLTTQLLFNGEGKAEARVVSKHAEPIVICGLEVVQAILMKLHTTMKTVRSSHVQACEMWTAGHDGDVILPGAELLRLKGAPDVVLMAERTLLNFLQRLCAIATLTAKYVAKVKHTKTRILDTRKTLPGFRHLEKYAVSCGGGVNHRMGLYDAMMVKDTHIDVLGGMERVLEKLPERQLQAVPVIIEVRNKAELELVLAKGLKKASRVLLDNMSIELTRECVQLCNDKIATESSGNVTLENVQNIAETGVDFISVGRLTHSAGNVDLSMRCDIQHV